MTPTTEKTQPQPRKNLLARRWIPILVLLALPLLTAFALRSDVFRRKPLEQNANVPMSANELAISAATPTAKATATAKPTATAMATATVKATATVQATSTKAPTATQPEPTRSAPETRVDVTVNASKLRAGPETSYAEVQQLDSGDSLSLVGRLSDNNWLFVNTSDGKDGWIRTALVNVREVNLDDYPILTIDPTEQTTIKVVGGTVNMRSGPHLNFEKIHVLRYGDMVELLGRSSDDVWININTEDGKKGWIYTSLVSLTGVNINYYPVVQAPPTPTTTPVPLPGAKGRWIDIDITEQRLYAFEDDKVVASFLVSTGIAGYNTERGQFRIDVKYRFDDMAGAGYNLKDVPYTMYYYESYAIHGTYWHRNFGTQMSHGCVNMDTDDAKWLYYWASVGTLVNIHW